MARGNWEPGPLEMPPYRKPTAIERIAVVGRGFYTHSALETPPVPERCMPDVAPSVDCMTLRPGTPFGPSAEKAPDRRMAVSDPPRGSSWRMTNRRRHVTSPLQ